MTNGYAPYIGIPGGCPNKCHHGRWSERMEGKDRLAVLTFYRNELLYDAGNYAFVEADIMDENRQDAKHQTFDIIQDGNVDRVTRILTLAHAECVEFLYPYTRRNVGGMESREDTLENPEQYDIYMALPGSFSQSTLDLLEWYIHEYLVCRVLYDWLLITKPEAAQAWRARADEAKEGIETIKNRRTGVVRRKQHPFP